MESELRSALPKKTLKQLKSLQNSDIVIGIPSYNCAHTINYVVYQTAKGLKEFFPEKEAVMIVSDGGSSDGTLNVVTALKMPWRIQILPIKYVGISGKGSALKAIFEAMIQLDAQAVMVVDSDLRSITPHWVNLLLSSVLQGTGLVTPLYSRYKYDGTITNFVCYPFTHALYAKGIRQPIGGDFSLSRKLVEKILESELWSTPYVHRFGVDILETHTALGEGFEIKQAFLGSKIHEAKDPSKHLVPMFWDVSGALFSCTEIYEDVWRSLHLQQGNQQAKIIRGTIPTGTPEEIRVDVYQLLRGFISGFEKFRCLYEKVLDAQLLTTITKLNVENTSLQASFHFSGETWAKCVYSFAAAFKRRIEVGGNNNLLEAFRILWLGKVASFVLQTLELDGRAAEKKIEEEAKTFRKYRSYLLDIY